MTMIREETLVTEVENTFVSTAKAMIREEAFTEEENAFIFTIKTTGNAETFSLPLENGGSYDFTVDWGDSNSDDITVYDQAEVTHTYASAGTYEIKITGTIVGWSFNWSEDCEKIYELKSWGPFRLGNSLWIFGGCANLTITATDALDLTGITDLESLFDDCSSLTTIPSINNWDVSSITNMLYLFYGATLFNQNISSWDTSSVTNMEMMFMNATSFQQNISSWDISSVIDMRWMFYGVTLSTANYDALLIGWEAQAVQNNITFHGGNSKYSAGAATTARQALIDDHNWSITDGGQA